MHWKWRCDSCCGSSQKQMPHRRGQERLKIKSEWIVKSSRNLLGGRSCKARLLVLWLQVATFSERMCKMFTAKTGTIVENSWLILQQVNKNPAKRSTLPRCDTDPPVQWTSLVVTVRALPAAGPRTLPFHKHNTRHGKWSDSPSGCAFWPKNKRWSNESHLTAGSSWSTGPLEQGRGGLGNGKNPTLSVLRWTTEKSSPVHEVCYGQQRTPHNQHKDNQSSEKKEQKYNGHNKLRLFIKQSATPVPPASANSELILPVF